MAMSFVKDFQLFHDTSSHGNEPFYICLGIFGFYSNLAGTAAYVITAQREQFIFPQPGIGEQNECRFKMFALFITNREQG